MGDREDGWYLTYWMPDLRDDRREPHCILDTREIWIRLGGATDYQSARYMAKEKLEVIKGEEMVEHAGKIYPTEACIRFQNRFGIYPKSKTA